MSVRGRGDFWPRPGNCPHYFGIAFTNPKSGPDAAIMRIITASKKCGLLWSCSDFTPNNADIICIIEFVKGVLIHNPFASIINHAHETIKIKLINYQER